MAQGLSKAVMAQEYLLGIFDIQTVIKSMSSNKPRQD